RRREADAARARRSRGRRRLRRRPRAARPPGHAGLRADDRPRGAARRHAGRRAWSGRVSPLLVAGLAAVLGALVGAAWRPLVPRFAAHSADANEQPRWTDRATATPVLMAGGALAFAATGLALGASAALAPGLVFCALLVGVTAIDLRFRIVPNRLVVLGTPL